MGEPARLYLHCVSALPSLNGLGEAIPGFGLYPERALVMAAAGDLVCVPAPVDPSYLAFLNELGAGPAAGNVLVPAPNGDSPGTLAGAAQADPALVARIARRAPAGTALELHPYAATPDVFDLAAALEAAGAAGVRVLAGSPGTSARADLKHVVRAKALELGVPVAPGEVVELPFPGGRRRRDLEPVRAAIQRQLPRTGQVLVRGSSGASGSATYVVGRGGDDAAGAIQRISARNGNPAYLVEAMVDAALSPNLMLRIESDGGITLLGASDQRWGRPLVHAGNLFPSASRLLGPMEGWARTLAAWLRDEGYVGDVGFDFVEYHDPATGEPRALLAEVNPRVNGASYPLALRERLNAGRREPGPAIAAFASGTLETPARDFAELRDALGDLLFTQATGAGIVPYATGCLRHGRCAAVAFAASRQEALERLAEAKAAMEAPWIAP